MPAQEERTSMLLAQFHGFKFQRSVDLTASWLTQLQTDIGSAKLSERLSDDLKKACLIRCLPEKFQSTVFALKAAGVSKMSYEDVVQHLDTYAPNGSSRSHYLQPKKEVRVIPG